MVQEHEMSLTFNFCKTDSESDGQDLFFNKINCVHARCDMIWSICSSPQPSNLVQQLLLPTFSCQLLQPSLFYSIMVLSIQRWCYFVIFYSTQLVGLLLLIFICLKKALPAAILKAKQRTLREHVMELLLLCIYMGIPYTLPKAVHNLLLDFSYWGYNIRPRW